MIEEKEKEYINKINSLKRQLDYFRIGIDIMAIGFVVVSFLMIFLMFQGR